MSIWDIWSFLFLLAGGANGKSARDRICARRRLAAGSFLPRRSSRCGSKCCIFSSLYWESLHSHAFTDLALIYIYVFTKSLCSPWIPCTREGKALNVLRGGRKKEGRERRAGGTNLAVAAAAASASVGRSVGTAGGAAAALEWKLLPLALPRDEAMREEGGSPQSCHFLQKISPYL